MLQEGIVKPNNKYQNVQNKVLPLKNIRSIVKGNDEPPDVKPFRSLVFFKMNYNNCFPTGLLNCVTVPE